jgi:hypothetical protein
LKELLFEIFDVVIEAGVELIFSFVQMPVQFLEVDFDRLELLVSLLVDAHDLLFSLRLYFFLLSHLSLAFPLGSLHNLLNFERGHFIRGNEVML